MDLGLEGKGAIVTGGSRGIGTSVALTLARALELTLLCEHAQWLLDHGGDRRGYAAALRFARLPVDLMVEVDPELDKLLLS